MYLYDKSVHLIARATHIILAVLLFISSTGFVVNKHYCQNELKSMAIFHKAEPCHQEKAMKSCPMHSSGEKEKKGCCDDETEYVKASDEQVASSFQIDLQVTPVLLAAIFVVFNIELPALDSNTLHYLTYKPPIVLNDLSVLLQVFRL